MDRGEHARVLLIVEDRADVGLAFRRYFSRYFDSVLLASTPAQAESILQGEPSPTHMICDHWLGEGIPVGLILLSKWRAQFPSLKRCIIVSGSEIEPLSLPPGVDAVFNKPADMSRIREFLLAA
ncbi:MAG TPA: hypothetical protein PLJ27_11980 [Polyangiaceae bacterium]|jgi:DNA-binding NtrC family response regulator|nr:MAG: hypothetical protein BWY17_00851 [Deltaproteobacteria bacterium ADurb.Bin207]HNS96266.1 hypothetical protein [Polyangiaceae bacterium]HNZ20726.1 hypothetical protein [Polyangiaceae bacterium]HOD20659.1 hypothetical protein [Polyangiaceae bacterium]HOE49143.1 hypothetical protein [Polyangiaceae bacterium]